MREFPMIINGEPEWGTATAAVVNPATEEAWARVPVCDRPQLDRAMASAHHAFSPWRRDEPARRDLLVGLAAQLRKRADELAPLLTQEQGRPVFHAGEEFRYAALWCEYFAALPITIETVQDDEFRLAQVRRIPLGVVAAITPWNYPVLLGIWKLAPALLAGNTVVIKPSPFTPVTTLVLGEMLAELAPPGVVNVVSGDDTLGAWMTEHPVPSKVTFTGSVESGRKVAANAAAGLKRVTLELGGNDPAILLPGTDVSAVAGNIFMCAVINSGQACNAIKRVYVHDSQYDEVVEALAAVAAGFTVGDGMDPASLLGPLTTRAQLDRVSGLVEDARAHGATVVTGGKRIGDVGFFYPPTVVSDIHDGTRLVDEEQFGPVLPIVRYQQVDDAVRAANNTQYGLCGSVWGPDLTEAQSVAEQLECGSVWVNQHLAVAPNLPFGGFRSSGIGVENGPWGLDEFSHVQVLNVAR